MSNLKARGGTLTSAKIHAIAEYLGVSADEILGVSTTPDQPDLQQKWQEFRETVTHAYWDGEPMTDEDKQLFLDALDTVYEIAKKRRENAKRTDHKPGT